FRLGGETNRRIPGRSSEPTGAGWISACGFHGYFSGPVPRELRASVGHPGRKPAALSLRHADHQPRIPPRSSNHDADPVKLVPPVRPEPADLCAKYFLRETVG